MRLRWGIVGTGYGAGMFASDLAHARHGHCTAVAGRDKERAVRFAETFGIPGAYGSPAELMADHDVDVVYIATPHTTHAELTMQAIAAGKHVLCEKPLATDPELVRQMVDAARRAGVFLMEGFMYRLHPQTEAIIESVRSGEIGEIRLIRASFVNNAACDPTHRLFDLALGGGAIHDLGCYPMSMARLLVGCAAGLSHAEPATIAGAGAIGPTGVDEVATALLRFPAGPTAQLTTGITLQAERGLRIDGTLGSIIVDDPWSCGRPTELTMAGSDFGSGVVRLRTANHTETLIRTPDRPLFALEADHVAECLRAGVVESPLVTSADSLGNAQALSQWRAGIE